MDHSLHSTYYRAALLLGMVRGDEVHRWAEDAIARAPLPPAALIDVVSTPSSDLSGLRHALRPLAIDPEPAEVLDALLGRLDADFAAGRRGLDDTVTIVRQIRSMLRLPRDLYDGLNAALVTRSVPQWLARFRGRCI